MVDRQLVTFLVLPRKVTKRNRPRFAAAARYPALLDWSGGCGTRATRSNSPRRNPLTSLRYSAAHRGGNAKIQNLKIGWARCAHAVSGGQPVAHPTVATNNPLPRIAPHQTRHCAKSREDCFAAFSFDRGIVIMIWNTNRLDLNNQLDLSVHHPYIASVDRKPLN